MLLKSLFLTPLLVAVGVQAAPVNTTVVEYLSKANITVDASASININDTDVERILRAIHKIDERLIYFNKSITSFHSKHSIKTMPKLLRIQKRSLSLGEAINDATVIARNSKPLSNPDSGRVATAAFTMAPHITSVLANLLVHKHEFDTAIMHTGSVSKSVAADLEKQSTDAAVFSSILASKLSPDYRTLAPDLTAPLDAQYKKVVTAFRADTEFFDFPVFSGVWAFAHDKLKSDWTKFKNDVKAAFSRKHRKLQYEAAVRAEAARLVAGSQRDRTSAAQLEAVAFLMGNQLSSVETLPERVPYKMPVFVAEGTPVVVVSASGQVKANATAVTKEG